MQWQGRENPCKAVFRLSGHPETTLLKIASIDFMKIDASDFSSTSAAILDAMASSFFLVHQAESKTVFSANSIFQTHNQRRRHVPSKSFILVETSFRWCVEQVREEAESSGLYAQTV